MTRPTRVFVDSSVLIAAAISDRGRARDLLLGQSDRETTLFASTFVIEETTRNLQRKARNAATFLEILLQMLPISIVDPPSTLVSHCMDVVHAKDAPIVAAAVSASADVLVSYGRKRLLAQAPAIHRAFNIEVVTPNELFGSSSFAV